MARTRTLEILTLVLTALFDDVVLAQVVAEVLLDVEQLGCW